MLTAFRFGIAPWNAPFSLTIRAFGIPLICGNTVVLKSSEFSPRTQALAIQLFHEAGLPNGVLNYVSMSRESAPAFTAQIIAHPLVRKINVSASLCTHWMTNFRDRCSSPGVTVLAA